MAEKPHINMVVIGHVDHGKSTLVGRILLDTGQFPAHMVEKFRIEAKAKGKESFALAWIFDQLKEERERGVTIDVAHKRFDTDKYYVTIIDAPGHRDFVKNMITGTSQADAAILVVAAQHGVMAQTREHMFLARTLGVKQLIVAINQIDATTPPYDKKRFDEVKADVDKLAKSVGYKDEQLQYIPVSAFEGDNVKDKKNNMPWWNGETIVKAIDNFKLADKPVNLPLRWPIQDVYTIKGVGTVPVGKIECGIMKVGQTLIFKPGVKPGGAVGEVKTIEMHHEQIAQGMPGDNVGVNVRGIAKNDIRRGDVAGPTDQPPTVAKSFIAQIMVLNHPSVITKGYTPVFHCYTAQVACRIEEIQKKLDPKTGEVKEVNPDFIKTGDAAIVKVIPTRPMVIEPSKKIPQLGRFAIRDMGQTVAAGVCLEVEEAK
ncbi:MAG: translation elongation factor EF-1 subunit alpha [Euryarchaeota archaeon]|nr:translation elongation factor EF-1 subunit alpha [Euryarchaeota archaeon]